MPGELAAGRFAPLSSLMKLTDTDGKTDDAAAGWLYGGVGAWNGVSVDVKEIWSAEASAAGASAFCHIRPAEAGWGVGAYANIGKMARIFAGITGFSLGSATDAGADGGLGTYADDETTDADDGGDAAGDVSEKSVATSEYYYAHLYAEYKAKSVRVTAEAAAPLAGESLTAALSLRLNYRVKGSSAEYRAIFYPADGAFPMSRLRKQLLSEIGEKEPSAPMQKHAVRMTLPFISDAVKLIPELGFTESDGVKRICGQAEARARLGRLDAANKHTTKIFATGADSALHTSGASINYRTVYPVEIRAVFQRAYGGNKNARNTYTLEAPSSLIPSAVVAPYIRGKYASVNEYWLGVKSEFHLYKKTWTGVMLEFPVNVKGADDVYIKVSSSYSF
ncbi:hypothetical protein R80B4_02116 [Fibrobacteres bacterium R8-0-B4]